jgi:hypothetical protein
MMVSKPEGLLRLPLCRLALKGAAGTRDLF